MGDEIVRVQNLEVLRVDAENSLLYIKGAVPGKKNAYIKLTDAVKKHLPVEASVPAFFKQDAQITDNKGEEQVAVVAEENDKKVEDSQAVKQEDVATENTEK